MKSPVILSLKAWPEQPIFTHHVQLSPNTSRMINNIDLKLQQILPVTFTEFLLINDFSFAHKQEAQQLYNQQIKRKKKIVHILRQMYKNRKNKSVSGSKTKNIQTIYESKQKRRTTKKSLSVRSMNLKQGQRRVKENGLSIFKNKIDNRTQEYQQYYKKSRQKKYKNSYEQQSTKSRYKNLNPNLSSSYNQQYYPRQIKNRKSLKGSRNPTTNPQIKNKQLYKQLLNIVKRLKQKLSEIDQHHQIQILEINQKLLTSKQRKRLLKIHQIQKQKLINQIFSVRKEIQVTGLP